MLSLDRQQQILNIIRFHKSAKVADLSHRLYTSKATIRRDLESLEHNGLIRRVYGGAVLQEGLDVVSSLAVREYEHEEAKDIIGRLAATFISDNNIIYLDYGSTIMKMLPFLSLSKALTIITTSPKLAAMLSESDHANVFCIGGRLQEKTMTFVGETAKRFIAEHNADTVFMSCRGISIENGVTEFNDDTSEIKRLMMRHSKKTVLLCDNTKFDKTFFSMVCPVGGVHVIVSETRPGKRWMEYLDSRGVSLVCRENPST